MVLLGLGVLSGVGFRIGILLLERALSDDSVGARMVCFCAEVWIIGVILYVLLEPLYSEILVTEFSIRGNKTRGKSQK